MTRNEVIAIARDVGMCGMLTDVTCTIDELERFGRHGLKKQVKQGKIGHGHRRHFLD